jgi:hypothetical protein
MSTTANSGERADIDFSITGFFFGLAASDGF